MSRKVLVAYDSSPSSKQAVKEAKNQAKLVAGTEVHLVSFVKTPGPSANAVIAKSIENEMMENFQIELEEVEAEFKAEGIPFVKDMIIKNPQSNFGKKVCEYAENEAVNLIIAGSRGLGNMKKLILGSVSNNIVQNTKCPVMIIK